MKKSFFKQAAAYAFSAAALGCALSVNSLDASDQPNIIAPEDPQFQQQIKLFSAVIKTVYSSSFEERSYRALTEPAIDAMIKLADPNAKFMNRSSHKPNKYESDFIQYSKEIQIVSYVLHQARELAAQNNVPGITYEKLVETGLKAMLRSLDPHSLYANEKEWQQHQEEIKGEFGGLGINLAADDTGYIRVNFVIENSPAARAGIVSGDLITLVNGESLQAMDLRTIVNKLRGKPGTPVEITILHKNEEPRNLNIVREIIHIEPVKSRMIETDKGRIGYIKIVQFGENVDDKVDKAIRTLENSAEGAPSAYIIDVRDNPGGYLNEVAKIADNFLESGEIVSTRGRGGRMTELPRIAQRGDDIDGKPLVILTNKDSASASEILASTLQHKRTYLGNKGRAMIFGEDETTYGKGSVQSVISIPPFGGINLTTALYYAPEKSPQNVGVAPDVRVMLPPPTDEEIKMQEERLKKRLDKLNPEERKLVEEQLKQRRNNDGGTQESQQKGTILDKNGLAREMNRVTKVCEMKTDAPAVSAVGEALLYQNATAAEERKIDIALACAVDFLQGVDRLTSIRQRPADSAQPAPAPSS